MSILEKTFGANFKTTVAGGLQALISALVTGTLTFPSNWSDLKQVGLFTLVVISTFFGVKFATSAKDRNVTGGSVQQTVGGDVSIGPSTSVQETVKTSMTSGEAVTPQQQASVNQRLP